jgi:predicted membrane channel-forming protein YqfA (hemolysin III family)
LQAVDNQSFANSSFILYHSSFSNNMSKQVLYKCLFRSGYFTAAMVLIGLVLNTYLDGTVWDGMTLSKSALTAEYCEFSHVDKLFHQSMNTYSNVAYFFFGVLIVQIALADYKNRGTHTLNRLAQFPLLSAFMGACFIYLSFGSAFFHASLTWAGQRMDMNGTYSLSIALLGIGLYHVFYKIQLTDAAKQLWIAALSVLVLAFIKIHLMVSSSILLPVLILVNLLLTLIHYVQFPKERFLLLPILSLVLMVIAVKIRTLDVQKIGCDPDSWYQGHALWHLLTAMGSFCHYSFFRFTKLG